MDGARSRRRRRSSSSRSSSSKAWCGVPVSGATTHDDEDATSVARCGDIIAGALVTSPVTSHGHLPSATLHRPLHVVETHTVSAF